MVVRVDAGFVGKEPFLIEKKTVRTLQEILAIPVLVPSSTRKVPLCDIGAHIAKTYTLATTPKGNASEVAATAPFLVRPGNPLIIAHWDEALNERIIPPKDCTRFRLTGSKKVHLAQASTHTASGARSIVETIYLREPKPFWRFGSAIDDKKFARNLRINLVRLHSERECLRVVIGALARHDLWPTANSYQSKCLQDYLARSVEDVARLENRFADWVGTGAIGVQTPLPSELVAQASEELRQAVRHLRQLGAPNKLLDRLERQLSKEPPKRRPYNRRMNVAINYKSKIAGGDLTDNSKAAEGKATMIDASTNIHQKNVGNVYAEALDRLSQQQESGAEKLAVLKAAFEQLKETVDKGILEAQRTGDDRAAKQMAKYYELMMREATTDKDESLLKVSSEGLIEAAKTIAAMALPIAQAVQAVMQVLVH